MLIDGKWVDEGAQVKTVDGRFVRTTSSFRNWVTGDGSPGPSGEGGFVAEPGRYHLYVALSCPWAARALMGRCLKGLEDVIGLSIVAPSMGPEGWHFTGESEAMRDSVNGATHLHEVYTKADPHLTGRVTVPVLWDKRRQTIVNNESSEILRMMSLGFGGLASETYDLYPLGLRDAIDAFGMRIYESLNNGVHRAGFAATQASHEDACRDVFATLDSLETELEAGPFVFGAKPTEADIRLFATLIRFDLAYHGLFKCNLRRIADYPNLNAFLAAMLAVPGIRDTVDAGHIKRGYYGMARLNPGGIVPLGPDLADIALGGLL